MEIYNQENALMSRKKEILIIIPAYNEEKNLPGVFRRVRESLPEADLLVVNDGSADGTGDVLTQHNVSHLTHGTNQGYGAAVQSGLKYAVAEGYPVIALMDGDGQHEPLEISRMLKVLRAENVDLVIGSRFQGRWKTAYPIGFTRKVGMFLFSSIASLLTKIRIKDTTSGFQVMNTRTAEFLEKYYPTDNPDAEIVIFLNLMDFKVREMSVVMHPRRQGKSMITRLRSITYPFRMLIAILVVLLRVMILKGRMKHA